jgi:sulfur carrier protein
LPAGKEIKMFSFLCAPRKYMSDGELVSVLVDIFGREVREVKVPADTRIADLVKMLGLRVSEVVVSVDGEVTTEEELVRPGSRIKLHSVVSGG